MTDPDEILRKRRSRVARWRVYATADAAVDDWQLAAARAEAERQAGR